MKKLILVLVALFLCGCVSMKRYKMDVVKSYYCGRLDENKYVVGISTVIADRKQFANVLYGDKVNMEIQMILLGIDYKEVEAVNKDRLTLDNTGSVSCTPDNSFTINKRRLDNGKRTIR